MGCQIKRFKNLIGKYVATHLANINNTIIIKKAGASISRESEIYFTIIHIIKNTSELVTNEKKLQNLSIYASTFGEIFDLP